MPPRKVEYRYLGSSGLRVSVPIMGTLGFGSPEWHDWILPEKKALPILKAAWENGVNTFDTANTYSNGESERILGAFVKKNEIPREEIIIATKCYRLVSKDQTISKDRHRGMMNEREYVNQTGLSRAAIFNAVDASLARLDTPYIDILIIHRFDFKTPAEETMKALHDLIHAGKVRYIGASSMLCWQFAHLNNVAAKHGWTEFVCMQDEYSLLYREEEREMFSYCAFKGIGIIPWAPLANGALARPMDDDGQRGELPLSDADKVIIKRVEEVSKRLGKSMAQIALAWIRGKVVSPVVGCTSIHRVEENIDIDFELNADDVQYLEDVYVSKPVRNLQ